MLNLDQTPALLEAGSLFTIEHLMLEGSARHQHPANERQRQYSPLLSWLEPAREVGYSLTGQLPAVLARQPDAILLTADSAIPLADTVRGVYDALGKNTPLLAAIDHKPHSTTYGRFNMSGPRLTLAPRDSNELADLNREVERMAKVLEGCSTIAILDQWISSGHSIQVCRLILQAAGIARANILPIAGMWYHDANKGEGHINTDRLSSPLADSLHQIGVKAVQHIAPSP